MKKIWSKNQLEVIEAVDDRILVSASAGSGKTTVMIERILKLLQDGVKISNMLVCTFTKASAADMRSKLYVEMGKRGLKDELKELSRADISTIDSFCQRIVSKYFYVLGIDPQFEMLDESESKSLKFWAAEQAIAHFGKEQNFGKLVEILRSNRRNETLKKAVLAIMDFRSINPDALPSYIYDREDAMARLNEYRQSLENGLLNSARKLFEDISEPEAEAELISAIKTGKCDFKPRRKFSNENKSYQPCFKYLKERTKEYALTLGEIDALKKQSESKELIESLIEVADFACGLYSAEKQKRSLIDFADLENMTLMILKSDVADEIRAKYKYVFVDEYQDINPLQESLIQLVASGNKLFMVGDLKQSIYAFRGCEPQFFREKYDKYKREGCGKVINLDTNYRSSKEVIRFVNRIFGEIMTDDFGGLDYKANPMVANKTSDGYVKFHIVTGKDSFKARGVYSVKNHPQRALSKVEAEATLIAYRVQELLKQEIDGSPVSFGDIAILSRSMGALESLVVEKLREINVPVSLKEEVEYLTRPETGQLINYLRLIDNRFDDNAMAISMLSPFGGFDENELAKIKLSGEGTFFERAIECARTDGKVKEFFDRLDRYYEISLTVSVDELADIIVSESGYFNYAYKLGEDAAVVLDKFLEFLGACPSKGSLKACLKFIDEHNPTAELSGDDNSVKLMTIHKSKGLEFRYVFVIGLGEPFNLRDLHKHIIVDKQIAMSVFDNHEAFDSDLRFLSVLRERKKQLEEEMRILYVAFTRAEEGLELFGCLSDNDLIIPAYEAKASVVDLTACNCALKWLSSQVFLATTYDVSDVEVESAPLSKVLFGKADQNAVDELKEFFAFEPRKNAPVKSYVSRLAHQDDEPATFIVAEDDSSGDALERGNAYHRTMEKIDFALPNLQAIDKADLELIDENKILVAAQKMSEFKGTVYKEKPFMVKLSAREAGVEGGGEMLIQGVIDLLVIDGDKATVVDYKTGKAHGAFEQGYIKQVNIYALAVERLLNKKVVGKFLYYFDSQSFVEVK